MKKKKSAFWNGFAEFIKRELEMALALLLMLGFIGGYSYASTPLEAGDIHVAQATSADMVVKGISYQGLSFASGPAANLYIVRTGYNPTDVSQTSAGAKGQSNGATYALTVQLDYSASGTFYLHGNYTGATVNGILVNSAKGGIAIDSSTIKITFKGGDTIQRLASYPGADVEYTAPPVATLYLVPSAVSVGVGQSRTFEAIALDANGNQINEIATAWTIVEGGNHATINKSTGLLTGVSAGLVKIQAKSNGATASATITVKEAPANIPVPATLPQPTTKSITPAPTSSTDVDHPGADERKDATPAVETAPTQESVTKALDQFAETQKQTIVNEQTTYIDESQVQEILNTTTTSFFQRVVTKVTLGLTQVAQDVKEIVIGNTVVLEDGSVIEKDSAFTKIGKFIASLFGFGGSTGSTSGASPLGEGLGGGEDDLR